MRSYVPNTTAEQEQMLNAIGFSSMDELFKDIPQQARFTRPFALGGGLSEIALRKLFNGYDVSAGELPLFRGAGAYRHYIPAVVPALITRSEFYTAYTPYQAEMSQGMLQSIFEYQTLITSLTGMDASNASVYDGATACAEACVLLRAATNKGKVLVSSGLNPEYLQTIKTYARFTGIIIEEIPLNKDGVTDINILNEKCEGAAGALIQSPNFFGLIEDYKKQSDIIHQHNALLISVVYPLSLGLLKRPGDMGADGVVGEGQSLGLPISVGGPGLGFMAVKQKYIRNLPGRIVGETTDNEGNRAYVLTLQAREQHIRREKAASNICSNQCLCAIAASVYLAAMGPKGMREVASLCAQKAHYLYDGIKNIKAFTPRYSSSPFFNEFVMDSKADPCTINKKLRKSGFIGGLALSRYFKGDNGLLFCATEMNSKDELDAFLNALEVSAK